MKHQRLSLSAFMIIALTLGGCDGCDNNAATNSSNTGGYARIPLDENAPGAKISLARNFYVIFDGSGSMDESYHGTRRIDGAKQAMQFFANKSPADINLGLYVFSSNYGGEVVPLGPDNHQRFTQAVQSIKAGGGTPLAESIRAGVDKLVEQYKTQLGYGEFRLIVVTDGEASGILEAGKYAADYGIPIYSIGLMVGSDHPLRQVSVSYKEANNFDELAKSLEEALAELPEFDVNDF